MRLVARAIKAKVAVAQQALMAWAQMVALPRRVRVAQAALATMEMAAPRATRARNMQQPQAALMALEAAARAVVLVERLVEREALMAPVAVVVATVVEQRVRARVV
jgi:hypothetical protein